LAAGDVLDRHYHIERPLAVGGAGITYQAREVDGHGTPSGPDLAIKVLYTQRDGGGYLRRLATEAQILQELDHPNIVECRGFVHRTGHPPYLVTLYEGGGNLAEHLARVGPLPSAVAAGILRQVLLALDVAHQRGIVHRDLKPENVLLHERADRDVTPQVRVADYGIAKIHGGLTSHTRQGTFIGTPEYAAPEQFKGLPPTPATDVFSVGGVLFAMLSGRAPVRFTERLDPEACHAELMEQMPPRLPARLTEAQEIGLLQQIVNNAMQPEPERRWTIEQMLAMLGGILGRTDAGPYHTIELTNEGAPLREEVPRPEPESEPEPEPEPDPERPVLSPPDEPSRGRGGFLGVLGALGFVTTSIVGSAAALVILAVAAVGFGTFSAPPTPRPVRVAPIDYPSIDPADPDRPADPADPADPTDPVDPDDPSDPQPSSADEEAALTAALKALAGPIADACALDTTAVVTVTVTSAGKLDQLDLAPGYLNKKEAACVRTQLDAANLPTHAEGVLRVKTSLAFF
jgi:serine/threonine protein kinase